VVKVKEKFNTILLEISILIQTYKTKQVLILWIILVPVN